MMQEPTKKNTKNNTNDFRATGGSLFAPPPTIEELNAMEMNKSSSNDAVNTETATRTDPRMNGEFSIGYFRSDRDKKAPKRAKFFEKRRDSSDDRQNPPKSVVIEDRRSGLVKSGRGSPSIDFSPASQRKFVPSFLPPGDSDPVRPGTDHFRDVSFEPNRDDPPYMRNRPQSFDYVRPNEVHDNFRPPGFFDRPVISAMPIRNPYPYPEDLFSLCQIPRRRVSFALAELKDSGPRCITISSAKYILSDKIHAILRASGRIIKARLLDYSTYIVIYATATAARHGMSRLVMIIEDDPKMSCYRAKLVDEKEIEAKDIERETDLNKVLDPPKCLVLKNSGLSRKRDSLENTIFRHFDMTFEEIGNDIVTYHRTLASYKDFLIAFRDGKSGISSATVEERSNNAKLKEAVYTIIRQKLIDSCMVDCNQILAQDFYFYVVRRAKILNDTPPSKKIQLRIQDMKFITVEAFTPMKYPVLPPTNNNILGKVKKATKAKRDNTTTNKQQLTSTVEVFHEDCQPNLPDDAPCSRLASIAPIKEKHKRLYLQAYARARLHPFMISRQSQGVGIRHTQFSQYTTGRRLYFEKSKIQGWGLFTMEDISPESLVIEYTGEIIRSMVADLREKRYEAEGFPHMYLFRINADTVVDATQKGGLARFLNHSCHPNCRANVVTKGNIQTITFYAIRNIKAHDEITFNYQMEFEDREKRERCYCQSKHCLGYLNYTADPKKVEIDNSMFSINDYSD